MKKKKKQNERKALEVLNESTLEVGQTSKSIVWKKNKATLWYYQAERKKYKTPLFLVYSLINESYILDLYPGMSMIEAFLKEGYDVYLLDFGKPDYGDNELTLDDYIMRYIQRAVQRAILHSDSEDLTLIGYCLGGTLATVYAALATEPIRNLILFAAPIDFEKLPFLENWIEALRQDESIMEDFVDEYGIIPGKVMHIGMRMAISPFTYSSYLSLLQRLDDEKSVRKWKLFNNWVKGHIPFAGSTFKQLITELGIKNKLVKNQLEIDGEKVNLANIHANLLTLATTGDEIVPEYLAKPIIDMVSSEDKTYECMSGGHVTIAMTGEIPLVLKEWLAKRSSFLNNYNESI